MRLVIHEWCCSGGLAGPEARHVIRDGDDIEALASEGRAMFLAALTDAVADGGFEVVALVDEARRIDLPDGILRRAVPPGDELAVLVEESQRADATLVIAPETAGMLAHRVAAVRAAGGTVVAPSSRFIQIASDKQTTIDALAAAGVAVPAGRSLAAGEAWPRWFHLPAVRKHRASVGCDELLVVGAGDAPPPPVAVPTRLEACAVGMPVGVSCILGPAGVQPLPPMRQRLTAGSRPRYLGGEPLVEPTRRSRARRLAVRAVAALAAAAGGTQAGWAGVDMILGPRDDGLDDRVLEVNPRLTTSFVGLTATAPRSLVRAIVDAAAGRSSSFADTSWGNAFTLADDERSSPATS
ncbi:MAG: ATP-grasp domain-containing protein [Pirellulales bacterium]